MIWRDSLLTAKSGTDSGFLKDVYHVAFGRCTWVVNNLEMVFSRRRYSSNWALLPIQESASYSMRAIVLYPSLWWRRHR